MLVLLLTAAQAYAAAPGRITGTVVDAADGESLPGAVVEVVPVGGDGSSKSAMSEVNGRFTVASVPYGDYTVRVSFLGYADFEKEVTVEAPVLDLGRIEMRLDDNEIEAVVLEVPAMRTSQKGDTVSYNAGAFKVVADADVEGLLKKMPGCGCRYGEPAGKDAGYHDFRGRYGGGTGRRDSEGVRGRQGVFR